MISAPEPCERISLLSLIKKRFGNVCLLSLIKVYFIHPAYFYLLSKAHLPTWPATFEYQISYLIDCKTHRVYLLCLGVP